MNEAPNPHVVRVMKHKVLLPLAPEGLECVGVCSFHEALAKVKPLRSAALVAS